jgi:hypothetical protein
MAIGTKFADRCDVALSGLGIKRHSVQAIRYLIQTEARSYSVMSLILHQTPSVLVRQKDKMPRKLWPRDLSSEQ